MLPWQSSPHHPPIHAPAGTATAQPRRKRQIAGLHPVHLAQGNHHRRVSWRKGGEKRMEERTIFLSPFQIYVFIYSIFEQLFFCQSTTIAAYHGEIICNYFVNNLLDLRMVSGIALDPLLHSSGVLVCPIRTDWRAYQQQESWRSVERSAWRCHFGNKNIHFTHSKMRSFEYKSF